MPHRPLLRLSAVVAAFSLLGAALALAAPDDNSRRARERYAEFQRTHTGHHSSRGWLTIPKAADDWQLAFSVADHTVEHRRLASSGSFEVRVKPTPRASLKFKRMAVMIRFKEAIPTVAVSAADRDWYESNATKVRTDKGTVYVVEQSQMDTGHFTKSSSDGVVRASGVLWGPNWRLHERNYHVDVTLAP